MRIPLDSIIINNKILARIKIDDEFVNELKESLKETGLLTPIIVRPSKDGKYEIIDGLHRYTAAKKLGWKDIEANIVNLSDVDALVYSITNNIQRKQMEPIDEAQAILKLINEYGLTETDVAKRLGKSVAWVSQRVAIALKLPDEVKKLLESGKIPLSVAVLATKITDKEKQIKFIRKVAEEQMNFDEAKEYLAVLLNDTIYTIGYEGRNIEEFIDILKKNEIKVVIDIREQSQFVNPQFNEELLKRILPQNGIKYIHLSELGVPQPIREPYVEGKIPHECFKAYYEYTLEKYGKKLEEVISENRKEGRIALMCVERYPVPRGNQKHYCHRNFAAEYLLKNNVFDKRIDL
ncbi:ParB/RepB/Spo0J family partition protein [Saccharolobus shibatae]|uniref:Chromosome partitioning protein ParB n=1 Tax=Saccharolobus shibatae TaxID=2286 RepID=A0A8F5GUZ1_9CREN|nr:ParB/RepB/Spo0J family partition protein [Saccharolobus shibatae]QXJ30331.1 Chromosome partitioning protein ParB [Saccharolobus shibatae]QXJ30433.1 Chromosome partitioning protein ParB [Saccharolobus shibatae]